MDTNKILKTLLTSENVKAIAKKSGASNDEIKSIVESALPTLLGKDKDSTKEIAKKSGTNTALTAAVLTAALPLLLKMLGKEDEKEDSAGGLLGTLLQSAGGKTDKEDLAGALLGSLLGGKTDNKKDDGIDLGDIAGVLGNLLK